MDETKRVLKHAHICGRHFISGKPAKLMDVEDPDWCPSLFLPTEKDIPVRNRTKLLVLDTSSDEESMNDFIKESLEIDGDHESYVKNISESDGMLEDEEDIEENEAVEEFDEVEYIDEVETPEKSSPTELSKIEQINKNLESELRRFRLAEETILQDPARCLLFTGLKNNICKSVFNAVKSELPHVSGSYVKQWESFILTLYKLKMNHSFEFIGDQFQLDQKILMTLFYHCIDAIYHKYRGNISWPHRTNNILGQPEVLKHLFNEKFTMIVQSIVISIEVPENSLRTKFQQRKFLIGISTNNYINFVSDGFPASTGNLDLLYKSGFLDHLEQGDIILGSAKFFEDTTEDAMQTAIYQKVGPKEISLFETAGVETSKVKLVLDLTVQKIIRSVKTKYKILNKDQSLVLRDTSIRTVDKLVKVCCSLQNLGYLK